MTTTEQDTQISQEIKNKSIVKERKRYKEFHVDYLQTYEEKYNKDGEIISNDLKDISSILELCAAEKVEKRIKEYKGDVIRLQHIEKLTGLTNKLIGCKNIWVLQFIRIKLANLSGIATNSGVYSETLLKDKLDSDQYLADSTVCLYDADKQLFIIARNRDGVMPSTILEYFRGVAKNKMITYGVIPNEVKVKSKESSIYRRLIIGINDVDKMTEKDNKILKKIKSVYGAINSFKGYGYCNIKIELSMGTAPKNESMNNQKIKDTSVLLMESDLESLNKLEISTKDEADTSVEVIDLLNNKVKDKFSIGYSREEPIVFDTLKQNLLNSYNKKIDVISNSNK
ncbi:MAG: DUF6731 family protein [Clostridium celatum]|nr:DUF6731 family protein [Clostridium celatum]